MFKNRAIEILKNKYGVIGAILVSLLFFVLLYKYKLYIDGDAIADLVFAYKMNKSVKPIPDDVYFTTTLPIIFGNTGIEAILFMFKMSFFNTFFVARIVEMLIYCVLIDRILRKIDLGKKWIIGEY